MLTKLELDAAQRSRYCRPILNLIKRSFSMVWLVPNGSRVGFSLSAGIMDGWIDGRT